MNSLLIILDGFGEGDPKDPGNAQEIADMKFYKSLKKNYPWTLLSCTGHAVGLPERVMGNSEVGHFTMGAGRVVFQTLEMINKSIREKTFFENKIFLNAIKKAKENKTAIHLLGMISDEGVHAHINHLFALLELCKQENFTNVWIHAITDGRDVHERSVKTYLHQILEKTKDLGLGTIATIIGRFYTMDRDTNWDRTKKAFELMTKGIGFESEDALKAIDEAYERGDETDYYIQPIILDKKGLIQKNDTVIFFNFRTDRAKQISQMFNGENFETKYFENPTQFICFGPYSKISPVIFPMTKVKNNLGEYLSNLGKKQLRIAETEKYAHVTFFFNSQVKEPYKNEERILVNSPKCPSYAEKPEMSAYELTEKIIEKLTPNPSLKKEGNNEFDFIALNYANGDLVGHSGDLNATIKCCKVLDECLAKLIPEALKNGYEILITGDHGNCEDMLYPDGSAKPAHSMNKVPCLLISDRFKNAQLKNGKSLQDIAPTILELMNLKKPKEMDGESLIFFKFPQ